MKESHLGRGHPQTPETCSKISASHMGSKNPMFGKILGPRTPEVKAKISRANTGKARSTELRQRLSLIHKGQPGNMKGKHHSEDIKNILRKLSQDLWQDPTYIQKQMRARNVAPNKTEIVLLNFLNEIDSGNWLYIGDGRDKQYILSGKVPDFVHTSKKLIIELFGDYWHKEEEIEPRTKLFEKHGYQTLIVWEHELLDLKVLEQHLQEYVNGGHVNE